MSKINKLSLKKQQKKNKPQNKTIIYQTGQMAQILWKIKKSENLIFLETPDYRKYKNSSSSFERLLSQNKIKKNIKKK